MEFVYPAGSWDVATPGSERWESCPKTSWGRNVILADFPGEGRHVGPRCGAIQRLPQLPFLARGSPREARGRARDGRAKCQGVKPALVPALFRNSRSKLQLPNPCLFCLGCLCPVFSENGGEGVVDTVNHLVAETLVQILLQQAPAAGGTCRSPAMSALSGSVG